MFQPQSAQRCSAVPTIPQGTDGLPRSHGHPPVERRPVSAVVPHAILPIPCAAREASRRVRPPGFPCPRGAAQSSCAHYAVRPCARQARRWLVTNFPSSPHCRPMGGWTARCACTAGAPDLSAAPGCASSSPPPSVRPVQPLEGRASTPSNPRTTPPRHLPSKTGRGKKPRRTSIGSSARYRLGGSISRATRPVGQPTDHTRIAAPVQQRHSAGWPGAG